MPMIFAPSLRLHVQAMGPAVPGLDRVPIVMTHGMFMGSLVDWYFHIGPRLAEDRLVVMHDLRGHGKSDMPGTGYDPQTLANDLAAVVNYASPEGEPVDLVGHCWGALVSLAYALAHPHRVRRMVLIEAALPPWHTLELERFLRSLTPEQTAAYIPEVLLQGGRRSRRAAQRLSDLLNGTSCMRDMKRTQAFPEAALAALPQPVLALYGSQSLGRCEGPGLKRALSHCTLAEVEGNHDLHLTAPDQVFHQIKEFFHGRNEHSGPEVTRAAYGRFRSERANRRLSSRLDY
ncbi:Alpha/beta fold hydrolase [Sulfidibacter corallicola]|uniref:Alpha/beta fold hydrolase n=1 Tax=Sulfidibacter corallicola TaxID=2818388 RepID=A0A8A4TSX8_SULCO|nr:alpha/beta hydrolase [Sulfidibacter corallicola]QTD52487.1 alpha/beta fold hydrolase [Sulfidibacter corallicola]